MLQCTQNAPESSDFTCTDLLLPEKAADKTFVMDSRVKNALWGNSMIGMLYIVQTPKPEGGHLMRLLRYKFNPATKPQTY